MLFKDKIYVSLYTLMHFFFVIFDICCLTHVCSNVSTGGDAGSSLEAGCPEYGVFHLTGMA